MSRRRLQSEHVGLVHGDRACHLLWCDRRPIARSARTLGSLERGDQTSDRAERGLLVDTAKRDAVPADQLTEHGGIELPAANRVI